MSPLAKHPAKFSEPILEALGYLLRQEQREWGCPIDVLDPFAGTGRIHRLHDPGVIHTVGWELEAEWVTCHSRTIWGDSIRWMEDYALSAGHGYHAIATSPCYGNRLADHHEAKDGSVRRSYRHDLGRLPSPGSNATLAWGPAYWAFMARAYRAMLGALRPGGALFLNVSDFVSRKQLVHAVDWHAGACWGAGFTSRDRPIKIETSRMLYGENREARADHEVILLFRRPG